jgi:hypothetical protein
VGNNTGDISRFNKSKDIDQNMNRLASMQQDYDICQSKVVSTKITEDGKQVRVVRLKKKKKKVQA